MVCPALRGGSGGIGAATEVERDYRIDRNNDQRHVQSFKI